MSEEWTPGLKKTRKTVWLNVDGEINTIRGHLVAHGYRAGYGSSVAKRCKCMQRDIPIEEWRKLFGENTKFCKRPANWQEIVYGDLRGSQKYRELGLPINYPIRRERSITIQEQKCLDFFAMRLTANPVRYVPTYY